MWQNFISKPLRKFYLQVLAHNTCLKSGNKIKYGRFMGTLTKRDLVVQISNEVDLVQSKVHEVVQKTLDLITDALAREENVELRNFGVLEVRLTKPRVGRNPNKPEVSFPIEARYTVKFKPGKVMRERVFGIGEKKAKASKAAKPAKGAKAKK